MTDKQIEQQIAQTLQKIELKVDALLKELKERAHTLTK
jgi:hypothetical protein